jgi:hypothetical protein
MSAPDPSTYSTAANKSKIVSIISELSALKTASDPVDHDKVLDVIKYTEHENYGDDGKWGFNISNTLVNAKDNYHPNWVVINNIGDERTIYNSMNTLSYNRACLLSLDMEFQRYLDGTKVDTYIREFACLVFIKLTPEYGDVGIDAWIYVGYFFINFPLMHEISRDYSPMNIRHPMKESLTCETPNFREMPDYVYKRMQASEIYGSYMAADSVKNRTIGYTRTIDPTILLKKESPDAGRFAFAKEARRSRSPTRDRSGDMRETREFVSDLNKEPIQLFLREFVEGTYNVSKIAKGYGDIDALNNTCEKYGVGHDYKKMIFYMFDIALFNVMFSLYLGDKHASLENVYTLIGPWINERMDTSIGIRGICDDARLHCRNINNPHNPFSDAIMAFIVALFVADTLVQKVARLSPGLKPGPPLRKIAFSPLAHSKVPAAAAPRSLPFAMPVSTKKIHKASISPRLTPEEAEARAEREAEATAKSAAESVLYMAGGRREYNIIEAKKIEY